MFACIYGQTLLKSTAKGDERTRADDALVNLAFSFSPLVERTRGDTVVLNIEGQDYMFYSGSGGDQWLYEIANRIAQCAKRDGLKVHVAIAANPDAAIHASRAVDEITVLARGKELARLSNVLLKLIDYSLAEIDDRRAEEIRETFALWGLRTFGDFARLPLAGVAQRLGQEGVRLQKLARGTSERNLVLVQPPIGFQQSLELDDAVTELEPLSFILSRLLNQLCANLDMHALATNELRMRFVTEPEALATGSIEADVISSSNRLLHERTINLPVPMRNAKTFLRLCLLDLESHPPPAPVTAVSVAAAPTKPRVLQNGLFIPLAPEPEKLELTLARLAKLVGSENIGSPELLDTHRPDAFRMKRFRIAADHKKSDRNRQSAIGNRRCVIGFRRFRPPLPALVTTIDKHPARISARAVASSDTVRGKIVKASGPWRASGEWWRTDLWARDEWDVAVSNASCQSEILCRIFRELASEEWFLEGIYD